MYARLQETIAEDISEQWLIGIHINTKNRKSKKVAQFRYCHEPNSWQNQKKASAVLNHASVIVKLGKGKMI